VTVEEAHVSVPITPERMIDNSEDTAKLDVEKLVQAALEMGRLPSTVWKPDGEAETTPHPFRPRLIPKGEYGGPTLLLFCFIELNGKGLGLVGLDGVEKGVEVGSAGRGELGRQEVEAARSVQHVALRGIF
jgi:hypothetical protein